MSHRPHNCGSYINFQQRMNEDDHTLPSKRHRKTYQQVATGTPLCHRYHGRRGNMRRWTAGGATVRQCRRHAGDTALERRWQHSVAMVMAVRRRRRHRRRCVLRFEVRAAAATVETGDAARRHVAEWRRADRTEHGRWSRRAGGSSVARSVLSNGGTALVWAAVPVVKVGVVKRWRTRRRHRMMLLLLLLLV